MSIQSCVRRTKTHLPFGRYLCGKLLNSPLPQEFAPRILKKSLAAAIGLLALIELMYSAVDDAALRPVVLDQIAETIATNESCLLTSFPDPSTPDPSCLARMDPVALAPYTEHYHTMNVY